MTRIEGQDEAFKGGYTMRLPVLFLRDARISAGAKMLMAYLTRYVGMRDRKVHPSQATLAQELTASTEPGPPKQNQGAVKWTSTQRWCESSNVIPKA